MSALRGPGRSRAFLRFLLAVGWTACAYYLATKAAHGLSRGPAVELIRNLLAIFMLIIGFGYMELAWDQAIEPLKAMGLAARQGAACEFVLGAELGWGIVAVLMLIVALVGHFYVQLSGTGNAWSKLFLQIFTLAAGALAGEIAFRGYPFQKLIETTGPFAATMLAGIGFALLRYESVGATPAAVWVSALAAILLSLAYIRTRALWFPWGLHFAWTASITILFGQPLAGNRHASSVIHSYADGPAWLTGGEFGPMGSVVGLLLLFVEIFVLASITSDLAWKYDQPELKPAGIPVEIQPKYPAVTVAGGHEPPKSQLVQISSASAPSPLLEDHDAQESARASTERGDGTGHPHVG